MAWCCCADEQVFAACFYVEEPDLRLLLRKLPNGIPFHVAEEASQLLTNVLEALEEAFNWKDLKSCRFKIAVNHLSSYTRKVLNCTFLVLVGYVTSYGAISKVTQGSARFVEG